MHRIPHQRHTPLCPQPPRRRPIRQLQALDLCLIRDSLCQTPKRLGPSVRKLLDQRHAFTGGRRKVDWLGRAKESWPDGPGDANLASVFPSGVVDIAGCVEDCL